MTLLVIIDLSRDLAYLDQASATAEGVDLQQTATLFLEGSLLGEFLYLCSIPNFGDCILTDPADVEAYVMAYSGGTVRPIRMAHPVSASAFSATGT